MILPATDTWSSRWPIDEGMFRRQEGPRAPRSEVGREAVARLVERLPPAGTLYLRGSCLEDPEPHPRADIDLMWISDATTRLDDCRDMAVALRDLDRSVDAQPLTRDELLSSRPFSLLVGYRALRIGGPPLTLPLIRADRAFVLEHWDLYAPILLPDHLPDHQLARVCMVKQLLRSVALLRLLERDEFSRDLALCAEWAREIDPGLGGVCARALASLSAPEDVDLRPARARLQALFELRLSARF